MNFADLHIFKTVADEGGITKAARKLHRVPSNITTRIKQLESEVGTLLFHRSRQRLHLSPHGELLLGYAARLIDLSEEARHAVADTKPRGLLRLGARIDRLIRGKRAKLTADRVAYFCHPDWTVDPAKRPPVALWTPGIASEAGLRETAESYRAAGLL